MHTKMKKVQRNAVRLYVSGLELSNYYELFHKNYWIIPAPDICTAPDFLLFRPDVYNPSDYAAHLSDLE